MKVKLEDIIEAMEMVDDTSECFLDKETGEVEWVSEYALSYDEQQEIYDRLDEHGFYRLPTQFEIRDYDIMESFVASIAGKDHEILATAIQGKGAFRRFKDKVIDLGLDKMWYWYRDSAYKRKAAEWCEENGVDYE